MALFHFLDHLDGSGQGPGDGASQEETERQSRHHSEQNRRPDGERDGLGDAFPFLGMMGDFCLGAGHQLVEQGPGGVQGPGIDLHRLGFHLLLGFQRHFDGSDQIQDVTFDLADPGKHFGHEDLAGQLRLLDGKIIADGSHRPFGLLQLRQQVFPGQGHFGVLGLQGGDPAAEAGFQRIQFDGQFDGVDDVFAQIGRPRLEVAQVGLGVSGEAGGILNLVGVEHLAQAQKFP